MAKTPGLTKGAKLLREYIEKRGLTRAEAGRQLKASSAAVQYWLTGGQRPRADVRERIAKWTDGAVPATSWLRPSELAAMNAVEKFQEDDEEENGNAA